MTDNNQTPTATARVTPDEERGDLRVEIELPADADVDPDAIEAIDVAVSRRDGRN